ncbi:hypothetical protein LTR08_004514 [Meristemomyces frigidus]|nr:hypothetical protein LTR08_004514 [Meristemomyces frigidus]
MNGFADHGLDNDNFGENKAVSAVKAFDAFPKTKPSYQQQTNTGGVWTVVLICASLWLAGTELQRWWHGQTTHEFSVEQGVGHDLQINLDVVIAMKCEDLHVNVQDASGDRILAGQTLHKDPTTWTQWGSRGQHALGAKKEERLEAGEYQEEDVHDYLGAARKSKKYHKTPKVSRGREPDSCRIYGSMHGNKVQGDFHITARGHGYMEFGQHLDHNSFNFSHHINELSFGPFYPSLINPLDNTLATTDARFYKFQYYLSVVPTIYTTDAKALRKIDKFHESPSSGSDGLEQHPHRYSKNTVFTNQYAVTEQSHPVPENNVPGVFVKFDIEPIQLTIAEEWSSLPSLFIRLVNVISGVLVAGGWLFQISEWAKDFRGRRRRRTDSVGVLHGGMAGKKG